MKGRSKKSGKPRTGFAGAVLILEESVDSFFKHNGFEMAAALSSFGFFSLIPLLFFIMYLLGNYVVSSQTALIGVEGLATHMFPRLSGAIMSEIGFLTKQKDTWGIVSLIMLVVTVIPFMDTLQSAFRGILRTGKKASFLKRQLQNIVAIGAALLLLTLIVVGEIPYARVADDLAATSPLLLGITDLAVSFATVLVMVLLFYLLLMPARLDARPLVTTSLVVAALLMAVGAVFSHFLIPRPDYGIAFGSLRAIGIIIAWVYMIFVVILFGAELMACLARKDAIVLKRLFLPPGRRHPARGTLKKFTSTYAEGDIVFTEGETGEEMFYILSGSVRVNKKGHVIRRLTAGDYFGEMAMLLDSQRTASVVADAPLEVAVITRRNLDIILREDPDVVMTLLKEMASRLKATSEGLP